MRRLLPFAMLCISCASFGKTDSLLRVANATSARDTNLSKLYTQLAWSSLAESDTANVVRYFHKGIEVAAQQHFDNGLTNAWSNLGGYYTRYGKLDSAVSYFLLCLGKAKALDNISVASKSCLNIASCYLSKGDYASAIQYYLAAMPYLERANDQQKIAINYHCLGIAYYLLKNYPLSLKYYFSSMETGRRIGVPDTSGYNHNGIGVVYKEMKQYDSALYYLAIAHGYAEKNKDAYLLSHNLSNEGEVYLLQGKSSEARSYLFRAKTMQAASGDQRGMAETSVLLGDALLAGKQYASARQYFDSAKMIARAAGCKDVLKDAWKGLAAVYQGLGNYPASLDAYQNYAALKDSIYTEESTQQIADMQIKYNSEKKEKENLLLQKENAVKDLQLVRERNKEYILGAIFGLVVIAAAVYYNDYRLKQKNAMLRERELRAYAVFQAQEDEKGRLSKELHDGVGALLALIKLNISGMEPAEANEKLLARTKTLTSDAIKEVRTISHDLMPSVLAKAGLGAALAEMVESVRSSGAIDIRLSVSVHAKMSSVVAGNIFRIVQEAVNNILKHAAATAVAIDVTENGDRVSVKISDNGIGFDKTILSKITGNGLNNIYSRANALRGNIDIVTGVGKGTQINIEVPLNSRAYA